MTTYIIITNIINIDIILSLLRTIYVRKKVQKMYRGECSNIDMYVISTP